MEVNKQELNLLKQVQTAEESSGDNLKELGSLESKEKKLKSEIKDLEKKISDENKFKTQL